MAASSRSAGSRSAAIPASVSRRSRAALRVLIGGGLAFLAFPLHPADRPASDRAEHLFEVTIPMLFLQGTRDALADLQLLEKLVSQLGERATLKLLQDADHSYHVPARTGRKDPEVRTELLQALAGWTESLIRG